MKVRVKLGPVGVTSSQGSSEPTSSTDEEEEGHIDTSEDDNTSRKDSSSLSDDEDAFHALKRPLRAGSTLTTSSKAEERLAISELDRAIDDNDDDSDYDADCSQAADTCSSALTPRRLSSPSSHGGRSSSVSKRLSAAMLSQASIPEEDEEDVFRGSLSRAKSVGALKAVAESGGGGSIRTPKTISRSRLGRLLLENSETTPTKSERLTERRMRQMGGSGRQSTQSRSASETSVYEAAAALSPRPTAISSGFSSEILREVYGSKTSLLESAEQANNGAGRREIAFFRPRACRQRRFCIFEAIFFVRKRQSEHFAREIYFASP